MDETRKELLNEKEVVEEINRHRWLESEKAGHDIGFEPAAEDWLKRFSTAWMQYHKPEKLKIRLEKFEKKEEKLSREERPITAKNRRARTYY